ncbi:hypothetical protein [Flavobacterium psychrotolerans]|nr:hypothetical protein [Flavobacterium psychrotolerans]
MDALTSKSPVIGDNVEIEVATVVVKDMPDNCIVAGNPAVIKRYINPK